MIKNYLRYVTATFDMRKELKSLWKIRIEKF